MSTPHPPPFFFQQNTRLYLVPCLADGVTSWLNNGRGLIVAIVMTKLECTVLRLVLVTPGFVLCCIFKMMYVTLILLCLHDAQINKPHCGQLWASGSDIVKRWRKYRDV